MNECEGIMPNEKVRQENIRNVIRQAMKLFVANGIENTSMEMIARESGLTLRSVQNYFHTKNDLYTAVLKNGYTIELNEIRSYFASEHYMSKSGAEQVIDIISTTLNKAVEYSDIVFCTAQMQHVVTRASNNCDDPQLTDNWRYIMEHVQNAFDKGVQDGSVGQTTNKEIVDVKTIMLGLLGIREQIAYAMCNKTMREIFDPETAVRKYTRQMELIFQVK
jgi:Transcriptional regulator